VAFFLYEEGHKTKGKVRKLKNKYRSLVKSRIIYVGVMMDREYLQDLLHHARFFWKIYKGRKKQCTIQEVEVLYFISKVFPVRQMQQTCRNHLRVGLWGMRVMFIHIWVALRGDQPSSSL
jgi:hypothetical protein